VHPQNPAYSYAYLANVTQGYHTLKSDSGFNAMAYGYANAESYGYSAGANVKDLYQYISVETPNSSVNFPATCTGTPFYFSMTFPYQPTTISWVFGAALNAMGIADVSSTNPTPTSTVIVNGRTLYVYKLPTQYTVTAANIYPIKVLATNPTPDGCGGEQEINFDLEVLNRPTAAFTFTGLCANNSTQFTNASNTGTRPISSVSWTFGTLGSSTQLNPTYTFPTAGTYPVTYSLITDIGCKSDTITQNVTINPLPSASIAGTITTCINSPQPTITFTGSGATAPYTFTYNINGGATQTISTTGTSNSVTLQAPTNVLGVFAYNLINVAEKLVCWDDSKINKEAFITEFGSQNLLALDDDKWQKLDKIVISPGIPHTHQVFQIARKNKIPITSDIELFIEENPESEFIFITGTNGKSTVTALTGHILAQAGLDYYIGGNIGTAAMSLPNNRKGYIL
jgi:hypothetical protein